MVVFFGGSGSVNFYFIFYHSPTMGNIFLSFYIDVLYTVVRRNFIILVQDEILIFLY